MAQHKRVGGRSPRYHGMRYTPTYWTWKAMILVVMALAAGFAAWFGSFLKTKGGMARGREMYRTKAICGLVVSAAVLLANTRADADYAGNDLFLDCVALERSALAPGREKTPQADAALRQGICAGMVAGLQYLANQASVGVCMPAKATNGQALSIVVRWLHEHPEHRTEDFRLLALAAMRAAWPCPTPQGR